eukprot:7315458-Alexandrium_andersonii.AAC.1
MGMPDVGDFQGALGEVIFWCPQRTSLCHHRCPFWGEHLGLRPVLSISMDLLRCCYLWPRRSWAKRAVWALVRAGVWAFGVPHMRN